MNGDRRRARWPFVLLGAIGVGCFGVGAVGAQEGGGGSRVVLGFDAVAASDGVGSSFGDPNSQPYPVAAGQMGHTEATMSQGPAGYALASTAWPGPLVANAGSLAALLGGPPQAGQANYAGRAEAFSAGPTEADLGAMHAEVDGYVSQATNRVEDAEGQPGMSFGDVSTLSRSAFEAEVVKATSTCTASDIAFGEGAVKIGSVHTESESTTTGSESTAGGRTIVSGMTVAGAPAEVDEEGVRFTDPVTAPIQEQMLDQMGISMFVAKPRATQEANRASYDAGPLVVIWEPPRSGGYLFIYSICGSDTSVSLRAGAGFVPPTTAPPTLRTTPPTLSGGASRPGPSPSAPTPAPPTTVAPAEPAGEVALAEEPVSFVRDLALWPYVVGALCCIAAGFGLSRAHDEALALRAAGAACPLEGARPQ